MTLDNVGFNSVTYAVFDLNRNIVIDGGTTILNSWVLGEVYETKYPEGGWFTGPLDVPHPETAVLRGGLHDGYFEKGKPTYASSTHDYWLIARALAKG